MSGIVAELLARQRVLAVFGLTLLLLTPLALVAQLIDPRTLAGVNVWVKPAKFLLSTGAFVLTLAWFFGYVRAERRGRRGLRILVGVVLCAALFENLYIVLQAAQGLESHYNRSTPFHAVMYSLMGLFAMVLVATCLPLAREIARHPAPGLRPERRVAAVIGLVLTFALGGLLGGYLGSRTGHSVGAVGAQLPLFGWNRAGGDLRVAHFFGLHAEQALPMLAWVAGAARAGLRVAVVVAGAALYAVLTLAVFVEAVAGRPLLPG
jgi:hypothetical protein